MMITRNMRKTLTSISLYDIYKICNLLTKSDFDILYKAYSQNDLDNYIQMDILNKYISNDTTNPNIEPLARAKILEDLEEYLQSRYHGILGSELISVKNHKPDYFNKLYSKARKELSERKPNTRINMCSFLLAMLFSFKEYINTVSNELRQDQLETLSSLFSEAETNIHSLAVSTQNDSNFLICCFASFIKNRTKDHIIYGIQGNWIGWINESKDEVCLLISSSFYKDYVSYVRAHKSYNVFYSKSEFIRKVLIPHGLTENRMAGTKDRYNKERVFEGNRYSVLAINYNELTNYLHES